MKKAWGSLLLLTLAMAACRGERPEAADLVLTNGRVVTVDDAHPEAQAVAMRDGIIQAVGTAREMEAFVGPGTEVVDLEGRLAIPAFIEGHGHFTSLGQSRLILDLTRAANWDEIVEMVAAAAAEAESGAWIFGRGWHQEKWDRVPQPNVDGVPLHHELSAVSPDNPVILGHASGHAAFVNAKAMELAGIGRGTPDPPGGTIVRDDAGNPTGLLRETAQRMVRRVADEALANRPQEERWDEFVRIVNLAGEEALSKGVTSFHDAGASFETIDGFKRLADEGRLPVRLYVMVRFESNDAMRERLPDYRMIGYGNDFLTVRSIKRQIDGALGSHGAWLLEPYTDLPASTGLVLEPVEEIEETARIALEYGFQVNTHAIGDRANREVLNIYERAFAGKEGTDTLRWRIEHAQHLDPADVPRFKELGIIASMQGIHCASDAPWVLKRLGPERARKGAYLWRTLLDEGVVVTNGTDVPVEDIDPIASFYASVTRRDRNGDLFYPEQRMTRMEALRSYTLSNAYAAFEEDRKGSITPGKLADIVVLDRDILTIPEDEIPEARVDLTILGGWIRYQREEE
ncbi:MAG: amidohydrolase [Gemmatimonadota bacterium]